MLGHFHYLDILILLLWKTFLINTIYHVFLFLLNHVHFIFAYTANLLFKHPITALRRERRDDNDKCFLDFQAMTKQEVIAVKL